MDPLVAAALEALRTALAKSQGRRPAFLQLLYPDGTADLLPLSSPILPGNMAPAIAEQVPSELSDREKAVLEVLKKAEQPLKGRTVANRARLGYTARFRTLMSRLVERGLVIPGPKGGYWPANRPLPDSGNK